MECNKQIYQFINFIMKVTVYVMALEQAIIDNSHISTKLSVLYTLQRNWFQNILQIK